MLGLRSYVKYPYDKYIRGTIVAETPDKWVVEWESVLKVGVLTTKVDKTNNGLIEIMMCDEPVKNIEGRLILESELQGVLNVN